MRKLRVAIGQAGGPTAVINASLWGFILEAVHHFDVSLVLNGFQGLVEDQIVPLSSQFYEQLSAYQDIPGSCLGSGRWKLSGEDFPLAIRHLKEKDIHYLVMIGGNGTMDGCRELKKTADDLNYELAVIGIPKTVDNDLQHTDHSPGYGSAAKYVGLAVRDIAADLKSMKNFESVRIIETMGRHVGWLAAASALVKQHDEDPPHLIYIPEKPFDQEAFLRDVSETVKQYGYATVVVSEGLCDRNGNVLSQLPIGQTLNRQVLGGVSQYIAQLVIDELGLFSRAENLGMIQRSSRLARSSQDYREATAIGRQAAQWLKEGKVGIMLTIEREAAVQEEYRFRIGSCPIERVAGEERPIPPHFLGERGVNSSFIEWLRPLVGLDVRGYPELKLIE